MEFLLIANSYLRGAFLMNNPSSLSCRIEFQNKFYTGTGFKFLPFSFDTIREGRFDD